MVCGLLTQETEFKKPDQLFRSDKYYLITGGLGGLGIELDSAIFIIMILIPSIVSVLALISGGYLADSLIKKGFKILRVRKTVNTIGFLGGAICLSMIPFQDSHISIIVLLSFTNAFSGIAVGIVEGSII